MKQQHGQWAWILSICQKLLRLKLFKTFVETEKNCRIFVFENVFFCLNKIYLGFCNSFTEYLQLYDVTEYLSCLKHLFD